MFSACSIESRLVSSSGVLLSTQFYALYKQARDGPNKTTKPGFWDPTARAKW